MKYNIILVVILFSPTLLSQQIDFKSPDNIKLFADFLFCDRDYLRAVDEYEKYLNIVDDDSIEFKLAISYSIMNDQSNALQKFRLVKKSSLFYEASKMEILKSLFHLNDYSTLNLSAKNLINSGSKYSDNANRLLNISMLLTENKLPDKNLFLNVFQNEEKIIINNFYDSKSNPPYKSQSLAGILSAIIPGTGKIYTGDISDGITSFVVTSLFGYLAYTNFEHDHPTRAWIFTALGAGFYAGNIYGSIASAQIFNAKIDFEFDEGIRFYLQEKNYYTPVYEFCK